MSLLSTRQLNAYWVLGWALVKHVVARPFIGRRVPGPWLSRLRDESLGVVPPNAWASFDGTSRCIGCGVCEVVGAPGDTPMRWILSIGRQPGDAPLVRREVARLGELALEIERLCPARVPVRDLIELVRENDRMLGDA